ncbi:MAG: adenosylcobinamide-GDP ribazoletransferase [Pseudomonadales bacterium]|nr:adenosylcobinamide-GDP ribazoletransferase [Pseudomonadales bacterium]
MKNISHSLRPFLLACQFLTIIPVTSITTPKEHETGQSLLYYPLVGLILGLILSLSAYLLNGCFSPTLSAFLCLAIWVALTGALHLDGLADSVDGWAGGLGSCERTLTIMKDPRCGPMAVVSLSLVLFIKAQALANLMSSSENLFFLIAVPVMARLGVLVLFLTTPYVRPGGLGEVLANHFPRQHAITLCLALPFLLLLISPALSLNLILINTVTFLILRQMMIKRLGGFTGDTAGALVELLEVASLLTLVTRLG